MEVPRRQATDMVKQRQEQRRWQWQRRDTEAKTGEGRKVRGLTGLKKGREILTEKKRLQCCNAVRCGAVLREWRKSPGVGRGQGVNGPLYYSILSPRGGQRQ